MNKIFIRKIKYSHNDNYVFGIKYSIVQWLSIKP